MLRRNPVLHHIDRSFWQYVEKIDDGRMRCTFCGHAFAKDTSITRIKFHLARVEGRGVKFCAQVPPDVQDAALEAIPIYGPPEKKLENVAGSSSNEVTNQISASAQEQNIEMMMSHLQQDLSLEEEELMASIIVGDEEPRGDPSGQEEFERANDLNGVGIELQPDTPDDQDELKKLEGSKSRDMVDDFKSGWTGAVSASAQEQNNVHDMAQQQETLFRGEIELANDLTGGGIELQRDAPDVLKSGWTLLLTNLILEIASAVCDQLGYALVGMVLAFVALLVATADLIHMAGKERMSLLPIFHRPSTTTFVPGKPVGTIVEYFGWVGAVWQCVYSTVAYAYARQKKDNPIKMSLLPLIFFSCVVISKLNEKSSSTRVLRKGIFLTPKKPLYFG